MERRIDGSDNPKQLNRNHSVKSDEHQPKIFCRRGRGNVVLRKGTRCLVHYRLCHLKFGRCLAIWANAMKHFVAENRQEFPGDSPWLESLDDFRYAKNTSPPAGKND